MVARLGLSYFTFSIALCCAFGTYAASHADQGGRFKLSASSLRAITCIVQGGGIYLENM